MSIEIGDRFTVSDAQEVRDDKRNRVITRFLPEHDYRVTPRNLMIVRALIDAGKAVRGGRAVEAQSLASAKSRVSGRVRLAKKP